MLKDAVKLMATLAIVIVLFTSKYVRLRDTKASYPTIEICTLRNGQKITVICPKIIEDLYFEWRQVMSKTDYIFSSALE